MKRLTGLLIALIVCMSVFCVSVLVAPPAWADRGKLMKSSDYAEVTQAITDLLNAQNSSNQKPERFEQQLADLQWQKYILETAESHAQCVNQTGKTLAIYAQPKKAVATQAPTLYFLGNGQETDDDFICKGLYLPAGTKVSFSLADAQGQELTSAIALRILDGTQLIATATPDTGVISTNLPPIQIFNAGEGTWVIPTLTQADIDAQPPNAPQD